MQRFLLLVVAVAGSLAIPATLRGDDAAGYVARAKAALRKCVDDNGAGDQRQFIVDSDQALADCDKAIEIDPESAEAHCVRARVWLFKHEYDKCIADCDKSLSLSPKSAQAFCNRGCAWLEKNDCGKALADCNKALALNPKLADAFFTRATIYWRKGDSDKAMADFKQASAIAPNDSETLNNLGVLHWKLAQDQDVTAAKAELAGDLEMVKTCRRKSVALKDEATDFWNRGVAANPNSSDIHSNLGYAYSEANDLDKAEFHSRKAVKINNLSPRPHNNLGRVLLRQSYEREAAARETETKGETDPAVAAKVKRLREEAKAKLDEAIVEFKNAAQLDPALLEARLNLGGVYTQLNELDKADAEYRKILRFEELAKAQSIKDPDLNANFSRAYCGLAQTAIARKQTDEAIRNLQTALQWNPNDILTLRLLALQRYQHSEYRDGGKCLQSWLAKLPPATRQKAAEQFVKQLDDSEHHEAAAKARAAAKLPAEK